MASREGCVQSEDYRLTGSPGFPGTETGGYVGRPVGGAEGGAAATGTGGGTAAAAGGGAGRPLSPRFNRFRASLKQQISASAEMKQSWNDVLTEQT